MRRLMLDVDRVKLGPGGMDALISLGAGDMRRTLNILQVRVCMARHHRILGCPSLHMAMLQLLCHVHLCIQACHPASCM